jgi:ribosome-associated protein
MGKLDFNELNFNYARSSGKGGQNVNKTNTKALLTWPIEKSNSIGFYHRKRFIERYPNFINTNGEVVLSSQEHRTQTLNREECVKKLNRMIENTRFEQKARKATKPTRGSVDRRIKSKKLKGLTKKLRREKF